jgi:cell division protein FtsQ
MRIIRKIWWFPLALYMLIMPSFIADKVFSENCKSISVRIIDSASYSFITSEYINAVLQNEDDRILGKPIKDISSSKIENRIREIRELESVEVYKTADGVLHIEADQRNPVLRVITTYGNSYYLDKSGEIIQHSLAYTPRVIVVSGNISVPDNSIAEGNIRSLPEENILKKILQIIQVVSENEFWQGQIEQLWITENGNIDIIPRVGNHVIKIGSPESFERKLSYLEELYIQALPKAGWNSYREINLTYEGQIVCKKR